MSPRPIALLAALLGLAGCAGDPLNTGDAELDRLHRQSWQEAQALVGKEYVFAKAAWVCREQSGVYNRAMYGNVADPGCRLVSVGRFKVEDAVLLKNDGRTALRITGPNVAGYIAYFALMPRPFMSVQEYYATGKPE